MQGPLRSLHRNFSPRCHNATLRPALASRPCPPRSPVADDPSCPGVPSPAPCQGTGGAAVNCPTTRCSTPAAAPRTGWGESVPRGTQSKTSIPFAAIPHDIAADPRLSSTDVRMLAALFYFAEADTSCWPCDDSIADRVHCHPGTIQRSLRYLEDLGYIRRQPSRENPTGRLIHLTCREPDWERPPQTPTPERRRVRGSSASAWGDQAPALANGDVVVEGLKTEECALLERSRPDPTPPPVDLPTPVAAIPLQAEVPAPVPAPPVMDPPQPELPV